MEISISKISQLMLVLLTLFVSVVKPASAAQLTEDSYDAILQNFERTLSPYTKKVYGKRLYATGDWKKEYSRTSAGGSFYWLDGQWAVHITGWLARHSDLTLDAIDLVLCHELGHHVHGRGAEERADYFATGQCLPLLWNVELPEHVEAQIKTCADVASDEFQEYCHRAMDAGTHVNLMRVDIWQLNNVDIDFDNVVSCRQQQFLDGILLKTFNRCPSH